MNIDSIWHSCPTTPLRGSPSSDISSLASSPFPHPTHSPMTKFNQCCYMCTSVGISTRVWTISPRIHCWRKLTLPLPKTCFMCFLSGDVKTSSAMKCGTSWASLPSILIFWLIWSSTSLVQATTMAMSLWWNGLVIPRRYCFAAVFSNLWLILFPLPLLQ